MKNDIIMNLKRILRKISEKKKELRWQRIDENFNTKFWENVDFIYSQERTMNIRRKLMPCR